MSLLARFARSLIIHCYLFEKLKPKGVARACILCFYVCSGTLYYYGHMDFWEERNRYVRVKFTAIGL